MDKFIISVILIQMLLEIDNQTINKNTKYGLIGFGSPIIDNVLEADKDLELSNQIKQKLNYHMSGVFPVEFYQSVLNSQHNIRLLGGSALNSIRVASFLLKKYKNLENEGNINFKNIEQTNNDSQLAFIGSIGKDKDGQWITQELENEGVSFLSESFEKERTSTVIVLVENKERSFYSDLGSSSLITLNHFKVNESILKNSKIFYADAYLIGKRFDVFEYVFKTFYSENILLSLSTASDFIVRDNADKILELLPYIDILFINLEELSTLRNAMKLNNLNDNEFFNHISLNIDKVNKLKKRIFINTRGNQSSLIYEADFKEGNAKLYTVPVIDLDKRLIIDTNGAGDSFSGGFLAGLLMNFSIQDSAKFGNCVASEIIQLKGFQIPHDMNCAKTSDQFNVNVSIEIFDNFITKKDDL